MYVIVAGAGKIGLETVRTLVARKHDVVVVDPDREACERAYAQTGATAVHGSATDVTILREAGAEKADVAITMTGSDAANLSCALLARSLGVGRVVSRMRDPVYEGAYHLAGVNSLVRVADILVTRVVMEVEQPRARLLIPLDGGAAGGGAGIYAVAVPEQARVVGLAIADIVRGDSVPRDCLFVGASRAGSGRTAILQGDSVLRGGETVFVAATADAIGRAVEVLTELA